MDRRSRYLETALDLFIEQGYNGVSMDRIVKTTGGSKETLYRYFDSKEQLFSAIVEDLMTQLAAAPTPPIYNELPLAEALRQLGRAAMTAALSERAIVLLRLACGEYSRFPELARSLFEHAPAVSYARFRGFLEVRQQQGEVHIEDPQIATEQFLGGLIGHQQLRTLLGVGGPSEQDIDRRIDAAVTMFLRTYGSPHPGARGGVPSVSQLDQR